MAAGSSSSNNLTLRSSDGKILKISRSAAVKSATLRNLMEANLTDDVIPIPNVNGVLLKKVIAFLDVHAEDRAISAEDKEMFDYKFFAGANFTLLTELWKAANFLDIPDLIEPTSQELADMAQDKSVEWVRRAFGVENDFTPEEEAEIRAENAWAFEGPAVSGGGGSGN